jgi:hypothetical protein
MRRRTTEHKERLIKEMLESFEVVVEWKQQIGAKLKDFDTQVATQLKELAVPSQPLGSTAADADLSLDASS